MAISGTRVNETWTEESRAHAPWGAQAPSTRQRKRFIDMSIQLGSRHCHSTDMRHGLMPVEMRKSKVTDSPGPNGSVSGDARLLTFYMPVRL
jgi:hypothetical protein